MSRRAALLTALLAAGSAHAQEDLGAIGYRVELGERAAHVALVGMTVASAPAPLELTMPLWTPGAYELRTWGRNLTPLAATDAQGRPLSFRRTGPSTFRVEGHAAGSEVRLRYRVYAPNLADDASQIDASHALLNGSSLFLAVAGAASARHTVRVAAPDGWRVATALEETPARVYVAPSYEALIDAPIEVGRFAEAEVRAAGRSYRVVLDGAEVVPAGLERDLAALAEAEARIAGPPPYRRYLLLLHLGPDGPGKMVALEHAASTSVVLPARLLLGGEGYDDLLYVIAHELFHAWNARVLRPADLTPYDLSRIQPSRALWITEGLTEYYAHRAMRLAGLWTRARYLEHVGEEAARAVTAARRGLTLEEDAELAWQPPDDALDDPDAYYARGHLVALALDATVRAATHGERSLDTVLRALLLQAAAHGGQLALDTESLARAVGEVAGEAAAARTLQLVRMRDEPSAIAAPLAAIGLRLTVEEAGPRVVAKSGAATRRQRPLTCRLTLLPASPAVSRLRAAWLGE